MSKSWTVILLPVMVLCPAETASGRERPSNAPALLKPLNLSSLNTPAEEDDPFISRDSLRLYYVSKANKKCTLMVSEQRRKQPLFPGSERWPAGSEVEGPNPEAENRGPFLTSDNHDLYYAEKLAPKSPESAGQPPANLDIVHAIRIDLRRYTRFTAPTFVQPACSAAEEAFPWLSEDGLELYFSRKTSDGWRLYVSKRERPASKQPRGAFAEPKLIDELPSGFHRASLSRDGRTMYLQGPTGPERWQLYRSTRLNTRQRWGMPVPIKGLHHPESAVGDMAPCLSRDGSRLYFSSDRPAGKGGRDLWVIETKWFEF